MPVALPGHWRATASLGPIRPRPAPRQRRRAPDDLFADCLQRYVITDAIRDNNVLEFSVEYWGKLKRKDGTMPTDEEVAGLNLREFYDHPDRI